MLFCSVLLSTTVPKDPVCAIAPQRDAHAQTRRREKRAAEYANHPMLVLLIILVLHIWIPNLLLLLLLFLGEREREGGERARGGGRVWIL